MFLVFILKMYKVELSQINAYHMLILISGNYLFFIPRSFLTLAKCEKKLKCDLH